MINNPRRLALVLAALLGAGGCDMKKQLAPERYLQGTVEYDERLLGFEVGGRVKILAVHRGQEIKAGDMLATLDDEVVKTEEQARAADVAAAEAQKRLVESGNRPAQIRAAEARVRAAKATEDMVRKNYERAKLLFDRGATPQVEVDDLAAQLRAAQANRQAIEQELEILREGARREEKQTAEARAEAAKKAAAMVGERVGKHELRAQSDGTVLDVHVEEHEVVAAGAPVLTVADTKKPYVDVFVPVSQLGALKVGTKASVKVDAAPEQAFAAHVDWIARSTEFTPRFLFSPRERPNLVVRVRVMIDDPDQHLHAGVPAFATIEGIEVKP